MKRWYEEQGYHVNILHKDGYDLQSSDENGDFYIEVKGSTKEKFEDFRPYFTLAELEKAIKEGERYRVHILLGIRNGSPKKHYTTDGSLFSKYEAFAQEARKNLKKWYCNPKEELLKPDIMVYLKKINKFKEV